MVTEQEAIASFLADFGSFLNENNFSVSPSALERATRIVSDFAEDETSLARILKPILCQNRAQYISFGDLFYEFFRRYDRIAKQAKKKDDLKGEHAQKMQEAQSFLARSAEHARKTCRSAGKSFSQFLEKSLRPCLPRGDSRESLPNP